MSGHWVHEHICSWRSLESFAKVRVNTGVSLSGCLPFERKLRKFRLEFLKQKFINYKVHRFVYSWKFGTTFRGSVIFQCGKEQAKISLFWQLSHQPVSYPGDTCGFWKALSISSTVIPTDCSCILLIRFVLFAVFDWSPPPPKKNARTMHGLYPISALQARLFSTNQEIENPIQSTGLTFRVFRSCRFFLDLWAVRCNVVSFFRR